MSITGPGGYLDSQAGLDGPGSSYYTNSSYGYSYSSESSYGNIYTHTYYMQNGVTTDYHAYSYDGSYSAYSRETIDRSFPQGYYSSSNYNATYGYESNEYASKSVYDYNVGYNEYQVNTQSASTTFDSGYYTSLQETGSSEFYQHSYVPGTSSYYGSYTVTDPAGYSTYTPFSN